MSLLLFDVDGTLVKSRGAGRVALRAAMLEVWGLTGPIDGHDFRGKTDPWIVRQLLRFSGWEDGKIDARLPEVWEPYLRHLDAALASSRTRPSPCAGVPRLLERLTAEGHHLLGLVTGNVAEGATRKLRAAGLDGRFEIGAFGSDSECRDDLPPLAVARASRLCGFGFRLDEAIVIGDTPEDVRCARVNGARVIAVATGGFDAGVLQAHGPDLLLEDLADTEAVLEAFEGLGASVRGDR